MFVLPNSAVTKELLTILVGDILTAKTFDDVANTIATHRMAKYFNLRLIYNESIEIRKNMSRFDGSDITEYPVFSTLEEKEGYNDTLAPHSKYLTEVFTKYHENYSDLISACRNHIIPHKVQSLDFTFNIAKRTKGKDGKSIEKNSMLFSMNGTGQVSAFVRGINESYESIRPLLLELKNRCITLEMPEEDWPEYFFVDNATDGIQNLFREFFPRAQALQDMKHIINRLLELCKKSSSSYVDFSRKLHGSFSGNHPYTKCTCTL